MERTVHKCKESAIQAIIRSRYRHKVSLPIFLPPDGWLVSHKGSIQYRYPFASRLRCFLVSTSHRLLDDSIYIRAKPRPWRGMSRCAARCLHLCPVTGMMDVSILPMAAVAVTAMITVNSTCTRATSCTKCSIDLPLDRFPSTFSLRLLCRCLR